MPLTTLQAAAGGAGGSWYVLLEGLAELVAELEPEVRLQVVEGGGIMNHANVGSGALPAAILNPPMTVAALAGRPPYERAYPELRVAVGNLTVNHLHLAVDRRLPLQALADWPAQRYPLRLPVDRVGTVDRLVLELTLELLGFSIAELERWGGRAVEANDYNRQLELWQSGQVDALWQFMGIPSPSIQAAHDVRPLRVLAFPPSVIGRLAEHGWVAGEIPTGAYGAVERPVPTVAMGTSLGFHADVPAEAVYAATRAICDHPERVRAIHPAAADFQPRLAPRDLGGPLHAGAERYHRERGWL